MLSLSGSFYETENNAVNTGKESNGACCWGSMMWSGAEREEEELEESSFEEEAEPENGLAASPAVGSYGTSPDGIVGYLSSYRPLGPGEFEPYVDMYAVKSAASKLG
ncbi:hypothetical protein AAFF_G00342220 [Aldrovandia affinis]|uniref:Uncharacterized protein n=1 Tax=Aldrovandia affinis TaxID=143900 RepID=A0AAD7VZW4_9TELE|nr:hypothetical protein AAFF_G00342220 [Aldrovandia affinis]